MSTAIAQEERALAAVSGECYVAIYVLASNEDARTLQKDITVTTMFCSAHPNC